MAYAQWLIPSKTQGSGNDTVNVTAGTDNTGRSPRQTAMTFKAANCEDVVRQVIQAGKPEFVTIQSAKSVSKDGVPTLTIEGTTNVYPKNLEETLYMFGETGTVKIGGTSTNNIDVWDFADETLHNSIQHLLNERRESAVLQTGFLKVDAPDENTLVITRYAEDGKDVFGQPCEGERVVSISRK